MAIFSKHFYKRTRNNFTFSKQAWAQYMNTLCRLNIVSAYCDHGNRLHTFTLGLFQRWRYLFSSNPI